MFEYKGLKSSSSAGLVRKIRKIYGEDGVNEFKFIKTLKKYNITKKDLENIKERYLNGESYNQIFDNSFDYRDVIILGLPLRNPKEALELVNKNMKTYIHNKYGDDIDNVYQLETVKEKCKNTKKERYDDEYYNNREKCKDTVLKTRGVENVFQDPKIIQRLKEINEEKEKNDPDYRRKRAEKSYNTAVQNNPDDPYNRK